MKTLLPEAAFKRPVFVIGTPGSGKSMNVAGAIVIPSLEKEQQVVIIDPTSAWYGLALSKSGKQPSGYNITVFGGEHGSVALTPNMGRAMGELLGREPISAVLSIWHFSLAEQIVFVSEFSAAIMEVNRKPITLVIDEADEFIPQKPELGGDLLKCKLRTKRIVTRGRKSGFRPVLITQRPQALDTSVRNGCQVIMAFQCTGHHERTQIEDYVKSNGDPKKMADMLSSLSELSVGEAWVWAPRDKFLKRIQFPRLEVFDSFKEIDETSMTIKSVPVSKKHLDKISAALKEFEEQRKANDPSHLKDQVRNLEAQVSMLQREALKGTISVERESTAHAAGYAKGAAAMNDVWRKWQASLFTKERGALPNVIVGLAGDVDRLIKAAALPPVIPEPLNSGKAAKVSRVDRIRSAVGNPVNGIEASVSSPRQFTPTSLPMDVRAPRDDGKISTHQRRVLNGLADWRQLGFIAPTRQQLAGLCGWAPTTSTFLQALADLRNALYIEYGKGTISLTEAGIADAQSELTDGVDGIHKRLKKTFDNHQDKVFDFLIAHATRDVPRRAIADGCNWAPTTSTFLQALADLRSKAIVDYGPNSTVHLLPWVFGQRE